MEKQQNAFRVEKALNSLDGMSRATPRPFLITRINARLQQEIQQGFWYRSGAFISRPLVAGIGLLLFLMMNLIVINAIRNRGNSMAVQNNNAASYEFAINVSSLYDTENPEP